VDSRLKAWVDEWEIAGVGNAIVGPWEVSVDLRGAEPAIQVRRTGMGWQVAYWTADSPEEWIVEEPQDLEDALNRASKLLRKWIAD
jgi:hypothetical protein